MEPPNHNKDDLVSVEGVTLSMLEGSSAKPIVTGRIDVSRSTTGLNLNISNEIDLIIPKDQRVILQKPLGNGTSPGEQVAFTWICNEDPEPKRSYQLSIPQDASPERVASLMAIFQSWTQVVSPKEVPLSPRHQTPSDQDPQNGLVLMDEHGQILGSVDLDLDEPSKQTLDKKQSAVDVDDPVVIQQEPDGLVSVTPLSHLTAQYGQSTSKIVRGAEYLSKGIIRGSESLTSAMDRRTNNTVSSTPATTSPLVFSNRTKSGFERAHTITGKAANISAWTLGRIAGYASTAGTSVGRKMGITPSTTSEENSSGFKGILSSSVKAAITLADSLDASGKHLMNRSQANSVAYTTHKYGNDAGTAMHHFSGSAKHCGLVFIDAKGMGRTALLKGFGKGVVKAKLDNGEIVELRSDEAGQLIPSPQGSPQTPSSPSSRMGTPPLPPKSPKLPIDAPSGQGPPLPPRPSRSPSPLVPPRSGAYTPASTSSGGWNDPPVYHFKS